MEVIVALFLLAFSMFGMVVFIAALYSLPVMLLWNWLLPELFHFPELSLLQAWGMMVLCGILFKSPSGKTEKSK